LRHSINAFEGTAGVTSAVYVADSSWRIEGLTVPMSGRWRVRVEILISDFDATLNPIRFCQCGSLNVRFAPKATELLRRREMSRCANRRHMQCTKEALFR
jgi:hypothetical protein